jgi:hypothetical protein
LIATAEQAGAAHSTAKLNAITRQVKAISAAILRQSSRFSALKGPLLSEEKTCLS